MAETALVPPPAIPPPPPLPTGNQAVAAPPAPAAVINAASAPGRFRLEGIISLDDFELGVTLGTGSFGRVRIATHKVKSSKTLVPRASYAS